MHTSLALLRDLWDRTDRFIKKLIFLELALVLTSSVFSGVAPLLFKYVVDGVAAGWPAVLPIVLMFAYVIAQWSARSLGEWRSLQHGRIDQRATRLLSAGFFDRVMTLPMRFHTIRKTGALSQTLANGLLGFRLVLHHLMLSVLPIVIEFTTVAIVLLFFGHAVFLFLIGAAVVAYAAIYWRGSRRVKTASASASDAQIQTSAALTDAVVNYQTVKYFAIEQEVRARFVEALDRAEREWSTLLEVKCGTGLLASVIFTLTLAASLYVAIDRTLADQMTIGEMILVNVYVIRITQPLETMGAAFRDINQGLAFLHELRRLFQEKGDAIACRPRRSIPEGPIEVRFEQVSYAYEPGRWVLRDLSLVVPAGQTVAVVGPSGAGKTSLVRLLLQLISPDEGRVFLGGQPLSSLPASAIRRAVSLIPQDIELFNASIGYNITLGNPRFDKHAVMRAAKLARIHEYISGLPGGYDTIVGNRGLRLSGGEKQRIAIARAIIREPRVYIVDEGTSSLDSRTEEAVLRDFFGMAHGKTVLIISHRLSTVAHADEIAVLQAGSIVERGTHSHLLERRTAYSELWNAEQRGKSVVHSSSP